MLPKNDSIVASKTSAVFFDRVADGGVLGAMPPSSKRLTPASSCATRTGRRSPGTAAGAAAEALRTMTPGCHRRALANRCPCRSRVSSSQGIGARLGRYLGKTTAPAAPRFAGMGPQRDIPVSRDCCRAGTFRPNGTALAPNAPAREHSKAPRGAEWLQIH